MEITLRPTSQYTMYRGVEMRIWEGADESGTPLTALIHGLVRPGGWDEPPDGMILVKGYSEPDLSALQRVSYREAIDTSPAETA